MIATNEAEFQRLMSLEWATTAYKYRSGGFVMTCIVHVAWDTDGSLVFQWYSAQPAPNFGTLPDGAMITREETYLAPHYTCFAWISGTDLSETDSLTPLLFVKDQYEEPTP